MALLIIPLLRAIALCVIIHVSHVHTVHDYVEKLAVHYRPPRWGSLGHQMVMATAIPFLPTPWNTIMAQHAIVLKDLAIYPDVLAWDPNYRTVEFPRHFDDSDIPHKIRDVLVGSTDYALGVVPWAAENATANLTTALAENWDDFSEYLKDPMKISYPILLTFGVLCHYIADSTQPLHATSNYDGQLSNQTGVHGRYESIMVETYQTQIFNSDFATRNQLVVAGSGNRTNETDVFAVVLSNVQSGLVLSDDILAADSIAAHTTEWNYNATYYEILWGATANITITRLGMAVQQTADAFYTALLRAEKIAKNKKHTSSDGASTLYGLNHQTWFILWTVIAAVGVMAAIVMGVVMAVRLRQLRSKQYAQL